MKIRIMCLPTEADQAIKAIKAMESFDVIEIGGPYTNRGNSRMVRVYIEVQLRGDGKDSSDEN